MPIKLRSMIATILAFMMVLTVSGCATVKTSPEFMERQAKIQRMAVLPPDVQAYEVTFNAGNKPLPELQEIVKNHTASSLITTLQSKGYEVSNAQISQKDIDSDPALRNALFEIQTLYKKATEDIAKGKKSQFTYDIGSAPNYFADRYQVNVLVLTRQVASKPSGGVTAAEILTTTASIVTTALLGVSAGGGFTAPQTLVTEIAVIDADLGDILWYNLGQTTENFTKADNPKPIDKLVNQILSSFPKRKE